MKSLCPSRAPLFVLLILGLVLVACDSSDPPSSDGGVGADASSGVDASDVDAGRRDVVTGSDGGVDSGSDVATADGGTDAVGADGGTDVALGDAPMTTGFIANLGCSQTRDNLLGYEELGGTRMESWASGGCSIDRWADSGNDCWMGYRRSVRGREPTTGYFQICIRASDPVTYEQVQGVLENFRAELPAGTPIFVSGLEFYEPAHLCRLADEATQIQTRDYADRLAADGLAFRAPDLGPLTPENTASDNCHPGEGTGQLLNGQQLLDFFGR